VSDEEAGEPFVKDRQGWAPLGVFPKGFLQDGAQLRGPGRAESLDGRVDEGRDFPRDEYGPASSVHPLGVLTRDAEQ
jgi:hypothetical protein